MPCIKKIKAYLFYYSYAYISQFNNALKNDYILGICFCFKNKRILYNTSNTIQENASAYAMTISSKNGTRI